MKVRTVWGVLPVFIFKSKDSWGHARGLLVWLPDDHDRSMMQHELFHAKQWYIFWGLYMAACTLASSVISRTGFDPFGYGLGISSLVAILLIAVMFGEVWNSKWLRWRRETAAYGESVRHRKHAWVIDYYARLLAENENYSFGYSYEESRQRIIRRARDGRLY